MFAETEFNYKDRAPDNRFNRNPLLSLGIGADGLKTGHTSEAGYGLVGSAKQGDRRVIFVITGLASEQARAEEAERIVGWAFRQFSERPWQRPESASPKPKFTWATPKPSASSRPRMCACWFPPWCRTMSPPK